MKFARDTVYAGEIGTRYGEYVESFTSDNGQVSAELFKQGDGKLIAYVTFGEGISGRTVTDAYLAPLQERAKELGLEGTLRIIYAGG